jgi:hypothetical protein
MATVRHRKATTNGDSHSTPSWLYKSLDTEFRFDLDPCPLNPEFDPTVHQDGLKLDWTGKRLYVNPPYSDILPWVEKALASKALVVFLLPVRTDTTWFHLLVDAKAELRFLRKRVDFVHHNGTTIHPAESSLIAIVRRLV